MGSASLVTPRAGGCSGSSSSSDAAGGTMSSSGVSSGVSSDSGLLIDGLDEAYTATTPASAMGVGTISAMASRASSAVSNAARVFDVW